jgi:hypothetical protein
MGSPGNSQLGNDARSLVCLVLSMLGVAVPSVQSFGAARPEILGDVALQLEGYSQNGGSGWSAVILLTNISKVKVDCIATSYPAGLAQGSRAVPAKDMKTNTLTKTLVWTKRQPETSVDPRLLERYRMGQVFQLEPGEGRRLNLPIIVPKAHPSSFTEHLVFGYSQSSGTASAAVVETYVAEVRQK